MMGRTNYYAPGRKKNSMFGPEMMNPHTEPYQHSSTAHQAINYSQKATMPLHSTFASLHEQQQQQQQPPLGDFQSPFQPYDTGIADMDMPYNYKSHNNNNNSDHVRNKYRNNTSLFQRHSSGNSELPMRRESNSSGYDCDRESPPLALDNTKVIRHNNSNNMMNAISNNNMYPYQHQVESYPPTIHRQDARDEELTQTQSMSVNTSDDSLVRQPLAWTPAETEKIIQQMDFLTEKVCEDRDRFPKDVVSQHLRTLQALIQQDKQSNLIMASAAKRGMGKRQLQNQATQHLQLTRDDPLLKQVSTSLRQLQLVNLDKLTSLLEAIRCEEEQLVGKDILLLSGPSGSGKTATLHFFAGTDFEEVEYEGFFHLEPRRCPDPKVAQFETSCCRSGVTQTLQTAQVLVDGKKFWVCDTPGMDLLGGIEEEIAHGIGALRALKRARTVRPIIVLCKDTLGHRFVNLDKTWGMVTKQFILGPDTGLKPFNYIFTKFDSKHRTRLCQQFAHFQEDMANDKYGKSRPKIGDAKNRYSSRSRQSEWNSEEDEQVFKAFVDDIVEKTTPEAHVVMPMSEKPQSLLRKLVRNSFPVSDPHNFFAPMASEASLSKLQIQLEMTVHEISLALVQEQYDDALLCLNKLLIIARLMPEAEPYYDLGVQSTLQHATLLFQSMKDLFEKDEYATAIDRIEALQKLSESVPEARECTDCGEELLWRSVVDAMESRNFGKSYTNIVRVSRLIKKYPRAQAGIQRGLEIKETKIRQAIASGDCGEAVELIVQLHELTAGFPEARVYLSNGFHVLQKEITRTIEDYNRLEDARYQLTLLGRLVPLIPEAAEFGRHGLRQLLSTVEHTIDENEYSVTVNTVQGLLDLADVIPQSNDFINRGIQIIWNIFGLVVEDKHYIRAIGIVQVISGLVKVAPKAREYTQLAIEILGDRLLRSIQDGNYNIAMKMLLHLTKLECDFPETLKSECVIRGLKMIKQVADKAIQEKKYSIMIEFVHDLIQLDLEVPEAGRCARSMLTVLEQELEKSIHRKNFGLAIELLHQFRDLENQIDEVKEFLAKGQEVFEKAVKDTIQDLDPADALQLVEMLLAHNDSFFVAGECARYGLKYFRDLMEEKIDKHDYVGAAELWHRLYQLSLKYPKVKKTVQSGFLMLREVLAASLTEQNYQTATFIIRHFGKVENELPEADKCAKQSLTVIKNAILSSVDQEAFGTAMDILQVLVTSSKELPDAFKCAQYGIKHLQRAVETKLMAKKDYRKALELMDQSIRLAQELPDALKCAQGGLQIILKSAENAIEQGDYGLAVDLMAQIDRLTTVLPEAYLSNEIALNAAVRHLSWLREAVKSVVDQLGPNVPETKFTDIIRHLKSLVQTVLKAETLRYICVRLHQEPIKLDSELPAADEFCSQQIRRLTECVVAELLNIEIDRNSASSLLSMRASLLSTIIRLKVMNEHLYQCPGGDLVAAAHDEAFTDLRVLLDSVLRAAESREKLTDSLDVLELQVSFLAHVIGGFLECGLEISDDEHIMMAGFEARRLSLTQNFQAQIIETKNTLKNFGPLGLAQGKAKPSFTHIKNLDIEKLGKPRKVLLSMGNSEAFCALMPSKPKTTDFIVFVKKFDLSMVDLTEQIIHFLEKEHEEIIKTQTQVSDLLLIEKMAAALINDIKKVNTTLAVLSTWSAEVENRCRPLNLRLYKLKQALTETISRLGLEGAREAVANSGGSLNPFQCLCTSDGTD